MKVVLRRVKEDRDVELVTKMLVTEFHKEFLQDLPPVSVPRVFQMVECMRQQGGLVAAFDADGTTCLGAMGAYEETYWFSDERFLRECFLYVVKPARKSRLAFKLVRALKNYAKMRGLSLNVGVATGYRIEGMDRFYTKLGFTKVGSLFRMEG